MTPATSIDMTLTRDFVLDCYRQILGREPENEDVVAHHIAIGINGWELIRRFTGSSEVMAKAITGSTYSILKATNPRYLASSLSNDRKFACLFHNYHALQTRLADEHLGTLVKWGLPLIDSLPGWPEFSVRAGLFDPSAIEGEISMTLVYRHKPLAVLGFTISPAAAFDLAGSSVFLISRLQGLAGKANEMRDLTRQLGDITPQYALMHILEGIAKAHGVDRLIGVNARAQPSFVPQLAPLFVRSYDALFESLGATLLPSGLYLIDLPRTGRPLDGIAISHRARTRAKRARKQQIIAAACLQWGNYLQQPDCRASGAARATITGRASRGLALLLRRVRGKSDRE